MALENLFIRTQRYIGGVQLDAVISESHEATIRSTQNPVEFGANMTDHAIIEPRKLTILAEVSDTPIGLAAVNEIVDSVTGLFGTSTSENETRSVTTYNALVDLMNARDEIDIQTGLTSYSDMLIKSINIVRDKDTSRIARMVISLEQVIIATTEIIKLSADTLESGTIAEQATSNTDRGKQEAATPTDAQESSVLKSLSDWLQ